MDHILVRGYEALDPAAYSGTKPVAAGPDHLVIGPSLLDPEPHYVGVGSQVNNPDRANRRIAGLRGRGLIFRIHGLLGCGGSGQVVGVVPRYMSSSTLIPVFRHSGTDRWKPTLAAIRCRQNLQRQPFRTRRNTTSIPSGLESEWQDTSVRL